VLQNTVLRRIFGSKRNEVTGEWRRLHNEELLTKYYSGDQIKKNEMGGACSTCGERRGAYRVLVGRPEGRDHVEDLGVNGRIILKWALKKDEEALTGLSCLRIETGGGLL
jgi:hypothetical protein